MAKRIIILGAGIMQGPAIRIARQMGLETVVADANPLALHARDADRFECIDLKDKEGIAALGASLKQNGGLDGIMTAGTDFSATAAWAAEKLGLPGISYEAALDASDKERMRRCFSKAGIPSPDFITLKEAPGPSFSLPFGFPVVVKPVDNMGARGCRRADTAEELVPAAEDALGFSRSGRAIVESYMEGPEFSVDALVYNGEITICGLADRHIFFPPYFIEMGHTMPALLNNIQAGEVLNIFRKGVQALGIGNGAAKGDIKLTPSGPMIGEIAARLSGGYMSGWTYPLASGVDPAKGAIEIALGRRPSSVEPSRAWASAERAFISIPGRVRSVHGLEEARSRACVREVFLNIKPGGEARFPENNVGKAGNVITASEDRETAIAAAEEAARSILIRLEASNPQTGAFLSGGGPFPPDAFALTPGLKARLESLDDAPPEISAGVRLLPFPEFLESGLKDYTGRTIAASLDAVRCLTGLGLPLGKGPGLTLGRSFWAALARGGYQGASYVVDCLTERGKGESK